jgi:prepilin-type N-terminal cleavage/methylation domain-containing protein
LLIMRALAATVRGRLRGEEGFSLPELLMALALGLIVTTAGFMMFTTALRSESRLTGRDHAIQDGRVALERMIREIRQGGAVVGTPTAQTLSFNTFVANSSVCVGGPSDQYVHKPCVVTYSCASGACTRQEQNPYTGVQGSAVQVVSGLATSDVFEYWADPSTECQPPPQVSNEAVSFRDEATLRNSDPESLSRVCVSFVYPKASG